MKKASNVWLFAAGITLLFSCKKDIPFNEPDEILSTSNSLKKISWTKSTYASGLVNPIGVARGNNGWLWITECGTGNNDGRVSVIDNDGVRHTAITGFKTQVRPGEGPVGLNHLALRGQTLYILNGLDGNLYYADINGWKPGDMPLNAANLQKQNISDFVYGLGKTNSNIYNLDFGSNGDLFICDAGGNCMVRLETSNGSLSLFATFSNLSNGSEAVPTAIIREGSAFYVSGLGGFPFTAGLTNIYRVNAAGEVSIHASGFTMLTDIEMTPNRELLALQFASFNFGFQPFSGRISDEKSNTLLGGLMFPTSIVKEAGGNAYYVVSRALGMVYLVE